jgi:hypothetical protein
MVHYADLPEHFNASCPSSQLHSTAMVTMREKILCLVRAANTSAYWRAGNIDVSLIAADILPPPDDENDEERVIRHLRKQKTNRKTKSLEVLKQRAKMFRPSPA